MKLLRLGVVPFFLLSSFAIAEEKTTEMVPKLTAAETKDAPIIEQYLLHLLIRSLYGSFLVMVIVIILGLLFIKLKNNPEVRSEALWL